MTVKKVYHAPVVETEKLFDVEAGDVSVFARCWGLISANSDGSYTHQDDGKCKD